MTAFHNGKKVNYEFSKGVLILKRDYKEIRAPIGEVWRILEAAQQNARADEKPCPFDHKELFQTGAAKA
jgi:hypothetical protein